MSTAAFRCSGILHIPSTPPKWPPFRRDLVLYEDEWLIAVHKPCGVPSQAPRPEEPDDIVHRVKLFLGTEYLGVHQRLDRDTSGVMVFAKRTEANVGLARQFEGRTIVKRYRAVVSGWPRARLRATLEDTLVRDGERMVVARGPRAVRAVTQVRVLEQRGSRALLELVLETGRMHQARVQLAHRGCAIAGDALYGGVPAPRLMLHAWCSELMHPISGRPLVIRDERMAGLARWLVGGEMGPAIYDDDEALREALAMAMERRWVLGRQWERGQTTAFRIVNEEADGLAGLSVDVYGDYVVAGLHVSEAWTDVRKSRVLDALEGLGFAGTYWKLRPKQANVLVETRRSDVAPKLPVRGREAPEVLPVTEEGIVHRVRLGDGLSTGIFLDQRGNRQWVYQHATSLRVLNLFAYTCSFSLVAALGGAAETVSVDVSLVALETGRASFASQGLLGPQHTFVAEDVFSWLTRAAAKKRAFDLVVVDPPSYSSTKKRRFVADEDYHELVDLVARVVAPGGKILACCNHRGISRSTFARQVQRGVAVAGGAIESLVHLPGGHDFPSARGREPHLKSVLVSLASRDAYDGTSDRRGPTPNETM